MTVLLTSPVAGQDAGTEYSGPMEDWLVANGYASDGQPTDKVNSTGVTPDLDPTLAENREEPREELKVLGEGVDKEPEAPVETGEREPAPLDGQRNRIVGIDEDPVVSAETEARDGRVEDVEPAEPTPAPPARTRTPKNEKKTVAPEE